jgi:hypothetical protein
MMTVSVAWAQTRVYRINGVNYTPPTSHSSGVLTNDGAGNSSWAVSVAADLGFWTSAGSCPGGYAEVTAARGRYVAGTPGGGTNALTAGTALTNVESRAVGTHNHSGSPSLTLSDSGHSHTITDPGHTHPSVVQVGQHADNNGGGFALVGASLGTSSSATTGISLVAQAPGVTASATTTIDNAGSVAGTNAPYIQLMLCSKS